MWHFKTTIHLRQPLIILTAFLSLTACSLSGQPSQRTTFSGLVVDKQDNTGIPFTEIKLIISSDTLKTFANIDGKFNLLNVPTGEYKIQITNLGYHKLDSIISINNNQQNQKFKLSVDISNDSIYFGYSKYKAFADIKNQKMTLLLPGGFVSHQIFPKDTIFENKYQVKYISLGCIQFDVKEYNLTIMNYLDNKYGNVWRKDVRKDVIGIR
jgi:hypothetical protein